MNKHYLWLKAQCSDYYKLVNKLAQLNLAILAIKYEKPFIYLKVEAKTADKIQKYLVSYKFQKVKDLGWYALKSNFQKYHLFLICFLIGLAFLLICSHLVVEVNVIHENKMIRELILEELETEGVKPLAFKKSYQELQKIKEKLLEKYPDKLDWLEIETDGMIINVRVEERIITDINKENKKCNIIASKEGTIKSLLIEKGEALVRPNDLVKPGDVLISGIITHNNEEKNRVCAEGEVYAETWYTVKVSIPFSHDEYTNTGRQKYNLIWQKGNNKTKIFKDRFPTYESSYRTLLSLFDYKLILETEKESLKKTLTYSEEEALAIGLEKAEANLKIKLKPQDEIIDKKVLKKTLNNSKMEIEIFIIAKELISQEEIIPENIEGNDLSDMEYNQNNH